MSSHVALPSSLTTRLQEVARRVRWLRVVRGLSVLVLLLSLTAAVALLGDYYLELSALTRQIVLTTWLTLGSLVGLITLLIPLGRKLDDADLAAVIEQKYPDLSERLTSSVELAAHSGEGHGSQQLIALLLRETDLHTRGLDFLPAVSPRLAIGLGITAGVGFLVSLTPLILAGPQAPALLMRFLLPWSTPADLANFVLKVGPGDRTIARGESMTITARMKPKYARAILPEETSLIVTDEDGTRNRLRMRSDEPGEFSLSYKVTGSVSYQVEAGAVLSKPYQIEAVTRVELVSDSPSITITPPTYAQQTEPVQTLNGLIDLTALKHSDVLFRFRFNRPAVAASLEWTRSEVKSDQAGSEETRWTETIPLTLTSDRLAATFTCTALKSGKYRLLLDAEHDIRTEVDGGALTVKSDQPPHFTRASLKSDLQSALPYDKLPIDLDLSDDVGVARAEIEYRINDKPGQENIPLEGANGRIANARYLFALAGKVKEGDELSYRVKAQDNLPEEFGGPHTIYYPSERWLQLRILKQGPTIPEKDILAERQEIERRLQAIKADLQKEQRGIYKLQMESKKDNALDPSQTERLQQLQKENTGNEKSLKNLARDTANQSPDLQPLADKAQDVADQEMRRADDSLKTAQIKNQQAGERDRQLQNADRQVSQALEKLDAMKKLNEQLAKQRMEQARVEALAERQKELAERAGELAKGEPMADPHAQKELEQIKREQAEVADELQKLSKQSDNLREALAEARTQRAQELAKRAEELARQQHAMAQNQNEAEKKRSQEQLGDLAKKQQELADKARQMAQETRTPARSASAQPLRADDLLKAAEALKQGDANQAERFQEQAAKELDRLGSELERAINLARDPREAAKQLARLQDDLKNRLNEERKKEGGQPLSDRLKPLLREQQSLQQAAENLSVPPQNTQARMARVQATDRAENAARALERQDARQAANQMDQAREALEKLAERLPSGEQRKQEALREVSRLRQQQDQLAKQAETSTRRETEEQLARKQADLAEALNKLDTPNQEERRDRVQNAMNQALADLMDGRKEDMPASQQQARRELERLEQALRGQKPADEQAADLAREQKKLSEEAAQLAQDQKATPEQLKQLQQRQAQLTQQTYDLQAPEAPQQHQEATRASQQAAEAVRTQPTAPEAQQRMEQAARELQELARQMSGQESPTERAERLARQQAQLASDAERNARTPQQRSSESAKRQQQIAEEARQTRSGEDARAEKERAMEALNRAQNNTTPDKRAQTQRQAAEALRELADKMAGRNRPTPQSNPSRPEKSTSAKSTDSPQMMAQQLAQEQRQLAQQTKLAQQGKQPTQQAMQKLAQQQRELNQQASQLPANGNQKNLEQAREAMNQAQQALARRDATQAQQKQNEAAQALERLSQQLPSRPTQSSRSQPQGEKPQQAQGLPNRQQSEQARKLAQEQRELQKSVQKAKETAKADNQKNQEKSNPSQQQQQGVAQQQSQQNLAQKTGQLMQDLNQLGQQMKEANQGQPSAQAGQSAQDAARSAQQAQQAQQKAQQQARDGNQREAQQSQQQAAEALDRAAQQIAEAGRQQMNSPRGQQGMEQGQPNGQPGQSLQQAQGQIRQAQEQLGQGKPQSAQSAMSQAAQALQQAAQQLGQQSQQQGPPGQVGQQPMQQGDPTAQGAPGGGKPNDVPLDEQLQKYAGKKWGDLPGALRTKIVQDLKSRYGDDYATMIQLYFEQIADKKK